ncbi:MAG: hypothetical protein AAF702_35485 [Chloroflexota bacterium]
MRLKITYPALSLFIGLFLTLTTLHQPALGHSILPPDERTTILNDFESGPFRLTASHYLSAEFTVLEIWTNSETSELSEGVQVEMVAQSVRTKHTITRKMLRHHDTFVARLPSTDEAWQVTIEIMGNDGKGSASLLVRPYQVDDRNTVWMQVAVGVFPFALILATLLVYRRLGVSVGVP